MNILSLLLLSGFMLVSTFNSKANTTLVCPPDVWLNCGDEIWDLSSYGNAYYYINGVQHSAGDPSVSYDLTVCETGRIYRTWTIMDPNWVTYSCTQTIKVRGSNFGYHNIDWPKNDLVLEGCNTSTHPDNLPEGYGYPQYDHYSCSMVGASYKDQVFYFGVDCKKILRTWTVLDWCNYFPGNSSPGKWSYVQTIKISGNNMPMLNCPEDLDLYPENCDGRYVEMSDIVVNGQGCNGAFQVYNDSPYADENGADASGFYPIGSTTINYRVEYACGEEQICQQVITVKEKAAVPYCLATLNVALMPLDTDGDQLVDDGMVELWASDLNYASYHPCRSNEYLRFSFSSNVDSTSRIFTCKDVGENEVQMWVTDTRGNQSWCSVIVNVQNNAANIPDCEVGNKDVVGSVRTVYEEAISNVDIEISSRAFYDMEYRYDTVMSARVIDSFINAQGDIIYEYDRKELVIRMEQHVLVPGVLMNTQTNEEGMFVAPDINPNRRYVLTASKSPDMEGINLTDVELLERFLNGEYSFRNQYTSLAADINEDNLIDNQDLEILRALVDGSQTEWPKERKWIFLNKYELDDLPNGSNLMMLDLEERIVLDKDLQRFEEQEFVAIMKGAIEVLEADAATQGVLVENRSSSNDQTRLYPNPFINELVLEHNFADLPVLQIFDTKGQLIYSHRADNNKMRIDASEWQSGSYIYRLKSGERTETGRVLKLD